MCAAWAVELGLPEVGPDENVFDLGATSARLASVQVRLERELAVRLPLARLMEFPTPAALSEYLASGPAGPDASIADRMARRRAARRSAS